MFLGHVFGDFPVLFPHGWEVFCDYRAVEISTGVFLLTVSEEIHCCGCTMNGMEAPRILNTIEFVLAMLGP